jgi:hypothetical protein
MTNPTDTTLATEALAKITEITTKAGVRALSVEMGYGVDGNGEFFLMGQTPRVTNQKRNDAGRCTSSTYQYTDGSVLQFKWSEQLGPRYSLGKTVAIEVDPVDEQPKAPNPTRPHFR